MSHNRSYRNYIWQQRRQISLAYLQSLSLSELRFAYPLGKYLSFSELEALELGTSEPADSQDLILFLDMNEPCMYALGFNHLTRSLANVLFGDIGTFTC